MYKRTKQQGFSGRSNAPFFGFVGLLLLATLPTIIYPMFYPEGYRKIQEETRKNINQEEIQPGNMRVWSDPFDRKKKS